MTEAEMQTWWEGCDIVANLLNHLPRTVWRKQRLFACACCYRIWPLVADERSRRAVAVMEQYADNLVTRDDTKRAWEDARSGQASELNTTPSQRLAAKACAEITMGSASRATKAHSTACGAVAHRRAEEAGIDFAHPDFLPLQRGFSASR